MEVTIGMDGTANTNTNNNAKDTAATADAVVTAARTAIAAATAETALTNSHENGAAAASTPLLPRGAQHIRMMKNKEIFKL